MTYISKSVYIDSTCASYTAARMGGGAREAYWLVGALSAFLGEAVVQVDCVCVVYQGAMLNVFV